MGRQSKIKTLSEAQKSMLHRMLDEGKTLDEMLGVLEDMGAELSRSGLGRYKQQVDKVAAKLRQGREMAEAIVQKMGPEATEGEQGRFLVQMLTSITGDYLLRRLNEDDSPGMEAEDIQRVSRSLKDIAQASRLSQDYELKIREEARREAEARINKATEQVAEEAGKEALTPLEALERVRAIYRGEA